MKQVQRERKIECCCAEVGEEECGVDEVGLDQGIANALQVP